MRKDASDFAKDRYFNGYSNNRSVQENFNLITSLIQESAEKHIPSKTSRSTSSIPWITSEMRHWLGHVSRCPALYSGRIFVPLCRELIMFMF